MIYKELTTGDATLTKKEYRNNAVPMKMKWWERIILKAVKKDPEFLTYLKWLVKKQ